MFEMLMSRCWSPEVTTDDDLRQNQFGDSQKNGSLTTEAVEEHLSQKRALQPPDRMQLHGDDEPQGLLPLLVNFEPEAPTEGAGIVGGEMTRQNCLRKVFLDVRVAVADFVH
jgi:hypothetical protein